MLPAISARPLIVVLDDALFPRVPTRVSFIRRKPFLSILSRCRQHIDASYLMRLILLVTVLVSTLSAGGCTVTEERAGGGAVIGAGTGALVGALATGKPGGALAGAAIGGASGAMIGAATTPTPAYGRPVRPVVVEPEAAVWLRESE